MNILLLSSYLPPHPGGLEVVVDHEARALAQMGHEVRVITSDITLGSGPAYPENVQICPVPAWNILEERLDIPWPVFSPSLLLTLWKHLHWCDVVHAHGILYLNSFLGLVLARLLGKPAFVTEHTGVAQYRPLFKRALQRMALESLGRMSVWLARRSIGVNGRIVRLLQRLSGGRQNVYLLPSPCDRRIFRSRLEGEREGARHELGWDVNRSKVLFVGRLTNRKGIDLLLEAQDPRYDLVFCGGGDPSILGHAATAGVSYLPPRSQADLVKVYHAADVLALPSRSEGCPLVVEEALACGLPVLVGKETGLEEYRACAGLHFCELRPDSIRRTLLNILGLDGSARPTEDSRTASLLDLLPTEEQWIRQLYGWLEQSCEPDRLQGIHPD